MVFDIKYSGHECSLSGKRCSYLIQNEYSFFQTSSICVCVRAWNVIHLYCNCILEVVNSIRAIKNTWKIKLEVIKFQFRSFVSYPLKWDFILVYNWLSLWRERKREREIALINFSIFYPEIKMSSYLYLLSKFPYRYLRVYVMIISRVERITEVLYISAACVVIKLNWFHIANS